MPAHLTCPPYLAEFAKVASKNRPCLCPACPEVQAAREKLWRFIINLAGNALRYACSRVQPRNAPAGGTEVEGWLPQKPVFHNFF